MGKWVVIDEKQDTDNSDNDLFNFYEMSNPISHCSNQEQALLVPVDQNDLKKYKSETFTLLFHSKISFLHNLIVKASQMQSATPQN